ncbi:hypothetical protein SE17_22645 [Kouleothrix aurantiaca]|uniref:Uncharacterized protein n=1 Tax=Kouleothrix aurantiaca TaxID=186479 RepID=A0A0P9DE55_9CHLR|nr:hypothetical protein SE17_22645 [Kouleothrix aurantiaca]
MVALVATFAAPSGNAKAAGIATGRGWYLRNSNSGGVANLGFFYGLPGDIPIVGDWNGDGYDTPGVVR